MGLIVRRLDSNGDWCFGASLNDYLSQNRAVAQNLQTRLNSFLGNCFFDLGAGVNWLGFLGGSAVNAPQLVLSVTSVILNTAGVQAPIGSTSGAIQSLTTSLDPKTRKLVMVYAVSTIYGSAGGTINPTALLLETESGFTSI